MLSETYSTRQFYGPKPGPSEPLCLSLLIGPGAFMYALSSGRFKTVTEIGHVHSAQPGHFAEGTAEKLPAVVQNFFLQRTPFEKVNIAVLNRQFTMVPEAYSQGDLKAMLGFASGSAAVKTAAVHQVKGIHFCYTAGHELVNYLEKTFTNASIRHAGAVNLSLFFSHHSLAQANVFLNIGDGCMELCIKENNELLFYNVFQFETNEDILYYLLFTMEQFRQDPLQVKLMVAAERAADDELFKSLRKYVRQVGFCVYDPSVQLNGDLQQLPKHYYFTLLNQHLCEL